MQQLSGVDEDGAAIDGLSSKMQKAFDTVTGGTVKLTKQNGQLKSTYEIMDDLSKSWSTMTSNQKNYLAQTVAGTRNSKSFIALMEQWGTVQESYISALNSSGSAEEENAKYMESLQGRLEQLKSSWESLANTTINSGLIKGLVSVANWLVTVADKAGGLTPIIANLIGAVMLFKAQELSKIGAGLITSIKDSGNIFKKLTTNITETIFARKNYKATVDAETTADNLNTAAKNANGVTTTKNIALTNEQTGATETYTVTTTTAASATTALAATIQTAMGIIGIATIVITGIVQAINLISNKQKEAREASIKNAEAAQTEADSLEGLYAKYKQYASVSDRNSDQEEDYKNAQEEICKVLQKRIDKLKGLTVGTEEYSEALKTVTIEDINKAFQEEMKDNYAAISSSIDDYRQAFEDAFTDSDDIWSNSKIGFRFDYNNTSEDAINALKNSGYKAELDWLHTGDDDAVYNLEMDGDTLVEKYENLLKAHEALSDEYRKTDNDAITESKLFKKIQSSIDETKESYENYIKAIANKTITKFSSKDGFKLPINQTEIDNQLKTFENDLRGSGEYADSTIEAIMEQINANMGTWYDDIKDTVKNTTSLSTEALDSLKTSVGDLVSSLSTLSSAYKEQVDNGSLTADTVLKLIDLGYASALVYDEETNSVKLDTQALKELAKAKLKENLETTIKKRELAIDGIKEEAEAAGYAAEKYGDAQKAVEAYIDSLGDEAKDNVFAQTYIEANKLVEVSQSLAENSDKNIFGDYSQAEKVVADLKEVNTATKSVVSSVKALSDAVKEQNENGSLSIDTVLSLIDNGYAAALSYNAETGAITLNTEACKNLIKVKLQTAIAEAKMEREKAIQSIKDETNMTDEETKSYLELAKAKMAAGTVDNFTKEVVQRNSTTKSNSNTSTTLTEAQKNRKFLDTRPEYMDEDEWEAYKTAHNWDSYKDMEKEASTTVKENVEVDVTETVKTVIDTDAYIDSLESLYQNIDSWFGKNGSSSSPTGETEQERVEREANYTAKTWKEAYDALYKANRMTLDQYTAEMKKLLADSKYDMFRNMSTSDLASVLTSSEILPDGTPLAELCQEFIDLTQDINDLKLDKVKKQYSDLQDAISKVDNAISQLGNIDNSNERSDQANLLADKYDLVDDAIGKIQTKLDTEVLTDEQRVELESELNDLLQERISIQDQLKDIAKEVKELEKENKLLEIQNRYKSQLLAIEKNIYGSQGQKEYEHVANEQIKALQDQLDIIEKQESAIEKKNEGEQLNADLLQLQLDLQNEMNNRTTKVLTKQDDGSWQFEYTYDQDKVKDIQEQIKDKQDELNKFELDSQKQLLQDEIDKIQAELDKKNDEYNDAEYHLQKQQELEEARVNFDYADIDALVQKELDSYSSVREALENLTASLNEQNDIANKLAVGEAAIDLSSKDGSANSIAENAQAQVNLNAFNEEMNDNISKIGIDIDSIVKSAQEIISKMSEQYDFNNIDLSNLELNTNNNSLNKLVDYITKKDNSLTGLGQTFNIEKVEFPNAVDAEEIKNAILSLPLVASQYSSKK